MKAFLVFVIILSASSLFALTVMAPDNPSSLPLLIAADHIPELEVKLFSNHTQAHSLFLSGKVPLLLTGYAVGESFAQRDVPIKIAASWVSGLNYLVSADTSVSSFTELEGEKIYFPFKGSPIEKMSLWLAEQEGINVEKELEIGYLPFISMQEMMRQGSVKHAVMPVSSALQIVDNEKYFFSFNLDKKWQEITDSDFYPQLCLFYDPRQKDGIPLELIIAELANALELINKNPQMVLNRYSSKLSYSPIIINRTLQYLQFDIVSGKELQDKMEIYFEKSGISKPPRSFYSTD